MKPILPPALHWAGPLLATLALFLLVTPPSTTAAPDERKKKSRGSPQSGPTAGSDTRTMRPAVQPRATPPSARNSGGSHSGDERSPRPAKTPPSTRERSESGALPTTAGDKRGRTREISSPVGERGSGVQPKSGAASGPATPAGNGSGSSSPREVTTKTGGKGIVPPSSTPREGNDTNAQSSTAGDKAGGKQETSSPTAKQGPTDQPKGVAASGFASPSATASRSAYPRVITTKSGGHVTIHSADEEPAAGEQIEEKGDGTANWMTKGGILVRSRLTQEQIDDLKQNLDSTGGTNFEELNKNGATGIRDNLGMRGNLEQIGLEPEVAARIAEGVSKEGTGKAKDDAITDALISEGVIPAGLKGTGRSNENLVDLCSEYKLLGGSDCRQMTPEFVNDVEKAKQKGGQAAADAAVGKWGDRFAAEAAAAGKAGPPAPINGNGAVDTGGVKPGGDGKGPGKIPDASRLPTVPTAVPKGDFDLPTTGLTPP